MRVTRNFSSSNIAMGSKKIYKKETFKTENSDSVQWRIQEFVHWGLRFFICGGGAGGSTKNPLKTIDFSDTVGGGP